jgi:hypothetical protein
MACGQEGRIFHFELDTSEPVVVQATQGVEVIGTSRWRDF